MIYQYGVEQSVLEQGDLTEKESRGRKQHLCVSVCVCMSVCVGVVG